MYYVFALQVFENIEIQDTMWNQLTQNGVLKPDLLAQMMEEYKEVNDNGSNLKYTTYMYVGGFWATTLVSIIIAWVFKKHIYK